MAQLVGAPSAQFVLWIAVLAVMITAGVYAIGKIRAKAIQQEPTALELVSKFRDLHSQGVLSDAEYRTIKNALAAQLQHELKDSDKTG